MFHYTNAVGICLIALGCGILCALFLPVWCIMAFLSVVLIAAGCMFVRR